MRGTKLVFLVLAILMDTIGAAAIIWAIADGGDLLTSPGFLIGVTCLVLGGIFVVVWQYIGRLDNSEILKHGVAGTAQVLSVQDTGVTINNTNAVIKSEVMVTVDGQPPYPAEVRFVLGRTQWGAIQPGMTVPVKVDLTDPTKVAYDPGRPVVGGAMPGMPTVGSAAMGQQVITKSAADIIANGEQTEGVLHAVEPTGLTAGQVSPNLPPEQADDPITKVVFSYRPAGGADRQVEALIRVPDLKGHYLQPGERVPIAYLPNDPDQTATIDWSRL